MRSPATTFGRGRDGDWFISLNRWVGHDGQARQQLQGESLL